MIKQLKTKIVYENDWMKVREDWVEFPNGHQGIYGVVAKPDYPIIIVEKEDRILFVEQYRYPIRERTIELPMGSFEPHETDPAKAARREVLEETGIYIDNLKQIGLLHTANGFNTQKAFVFLASYKSTNARNLDLTEADLTFSWYSVSTIRKLIKKSEITDSPTVAAFHLYLEHKSNF